MAFDASPLASIGDNFNPAGAVQQAYTLKGLADQDQLNQLKLGQAKQQQTDADAVKKILSKHDLSTPEGAMQASQALTQGGYPQMGMDLLKESQNQRQTNQQYDEGKLRILQLSSDIIGPAAVQLKQTLATKGPAVAEAQYTMLMSQILPQIPEEIRSRFPAKPPQDPQQFSQLLDGAINGSEHARQILSQQQTRQLDLDKFGETQRYHRAIESNATKRTDAASAGFTPESGELLAALAERGVSLPAGLRSKAQIQATVGSLLSRNPDLSPDQIADKIKSGQLQLGAERKSTTTAAGVAGRMGTAENEIIATAPILLAASDAVPRGSFVPINKLLQMKDSSVSDPNLKKLRVYLNSMLNAYDQLAARGGTDKNKREEAHSLLTSAESPEALRAGVEAFKTEASIAQAAAEKAAGLPSSAAQGRGSASTGAQPPTNAQGWRLMRDAQGNTAYVSPDGKQFQAAQ